MKKTDIVQGEIKLSQCNVKMKEINKENSSIGSNQNGILNTIILYVSLESKN